jgi:hypothetical protein
MGCSTTRLALRPCEHPAVTPGSVHLNRGRFLVDVRADSVSDGGRQNTTRADGGTQPARTPAVRSPAGTVRKRHGSSERSRPEGQQTPSFAVPNATRSKATPAGSPTDSYHQPSHSGMRIRSPSTRRATTTGTWPPTPTVITPPSAPRCSLPSPTRPPRQHPPRRSAHVPVTASAPWLRRRQPGTRPQLATRR